MTDLLLRSEEQLVLGLYSSECPAKPTDSESTAQEAETADKWYRVSCNAGEFVVKANCEFSLVDKLKKGLEVPVPGVNHGPAEKTAPIMSELLNLDEIEEDSIKSQLIVGTIATHYAAIGLEEVVYIGTSSP